MYSPNSQTGCSHLSAVGLEGQLSQHLIDFTSFIGTSSTPQWEWLAATVQRSVQPQEKETKVLCEGPGGRNVVRVIFSWLHVSLRLSSVSLCLSVFSSDASLPWSLHAHLWERGKGFSFYRLYDYHLDLLPCLLSFLIVYGAQMILFNKNHPTHNMSFSQYSAVFMSGKDQIWCKASPLLYLYSDHKYIMIHSLSMKHGSNCSC